MGLVLACSFQLAQNRVEHVVGSPSAYLGVEFEFTACQQAAHHYKETLGCVASEEVEVSEAPESSQPVGLRGG